MEEGLIDILLPTYNGEKYIRQQLDSLFAQSDSGWKLLIRDDGSKDRTVAIIQEYQHRFPDKIKIITDDKGNLGITNNVFELLWNSTGEYVMLCDQDDVWFPNKISKSRELISLKEKQQGKVPILIHTESLVVDENLKPISAGAEYHRNEKSKEKSKEKIEEKINSEFINKYYKSLMNQCGYHKYRTSFGNLLLLNSVQGATIIMNKALKTELEPLKQTKIRKNLVHDSIISSVASIFGNIYFYKIPLMYYRQHGRNAVGINHNSWLNWFSLTEEEKNRKKGSSFLLVNREKSELIQLKYGKILSEKQKAVMQHFMKEPNNWKQFFELSLYHEFSIKEILIMAVFGVR